MEWRGVIDRLGGRRVLAVDAALALGLAGIVLTETFTTCSCATTRDLAWTTAFMLSQTLPLTVRRTYPAGVMIVVGVSAAVYNLLNIQPQPFTEVLPLLLALYSASGYARQAHAIALGIITALVFAIANIPAVAGHQDFKEVALPFVLLAAAWVVGDNTRRRRRETELLQERAERAEREREERARVAALEERSRIAREIHDVVAHSVSVVAVQAGAASTVLPHDPGRAREALTTIEAVSKDTMRELRRLLGVLREPREGAALGPQPSLGRLDELVEHFRGAGLSVTVSREGVGEDLPPGLDLSAYRVIQEALTNTLKHSSAGAARVAIRDTGESLEVTVAEEGEAGEGLPARTDGDGHGLVGMRERVALFGGTLQVDPSDGRFTVRALFPYGGAAREDR
jgi:signal transduction histidine kinase